MRASFVAMVLVVVLAGCGTTTSDDADRQGSGAGDSTAAGTPSSSGEVASPPVLVTAPAAQDALLKSAELAQIVGDTEMRPLKDYTHPSESSKGVEPGSCAPRLLFNEAVAAAKYQSVSGNNSKGARGQTAAQLITVFVDQAQPRAVVAALSRMFGYCPAGQPFSTTVGDITQHWMPTAVTNEGMDRWGTTASRAGAGADRQDASSRHCYHAALARANVTVESIVCGDGDSASMANAVIDRIASKLP